ncbi:E3 ubiquitin-protein ligase TRIM39-like [Halichoeres trimaculatus]|uniref:E3 ubiquitin-protein ligase TRIM39-like n=1 Tax=Halichoeres trimaculatus TaxID=147232 RepID=UPI003D9F7124
MSATSCLLSQDQFLCSICLDVFTSPVTLPCGHNFCKSCITQDWKINRKCKCPVCKKIFEVITELHVNTFISEMAAQFKEAAGKEASQIAQPGEVLCGVCTRARLKASKSCLVCLSSYCESHLQRHREVAGLKKHRLTEPLDNLEDRVCSTHNELMELYCRTDQVCVCHCCSETDHQSHDIVLLSEESSERRSQLGDMKAELQLMVHERELRIEELRRSERLSGEAAGKAVAAGSQVFSALIQFVESGLKRLTEQIRQKQETAAGQAESLIQELTQEISELMNRREEVEQLSRSDDHLRLLQSVSPLKASLPTKNCRDVSLHQLSYEGTVARAVAQLKDTLSQEAEELLRAELKRVQQYAVDVTLDPKTAHPKLILSEDRKEVTHSNTVGNLPDGPQRFSFCVVVLAQQSFSSGRSYYEVEVKGKTKWDLGVISESANRRGQVTSCPGAGYWILQLRNGNEYVALADPDVLLSVKSQPQRVGVFVDYEEGLVSFYNVDSADIIYSFTGCCFTENLRPFFSPCFNDDGHNSAPLRISAIHKT